MNDIQSVRRVFLFRWLFFISSLLMSSCATSQQSVGDPVTPPKKKLSSILEHTEFSLLKETLKLVVQDQLPKQTGTHHFFIARYPKDAISTYLFWKEGRRLWPIFLQGNKEEKWFSARYPTFRDVIDLDKGVVKTEEEIGTSSFLVTRSWVADKIYEAVVDGDLIQIE